MAVPATQTQADSSEVNAETLSATEVAELYKNCIKLASENKISAKNTWSLPLIDHMSDLVKPSAAERDQTNFQRASCTLETGVKIYSYRVDSVHSEVYKVLGGLSRTEKPRTDGEEGEDGGEGAEDGDGEGDGEGADGKAGGRRRKAASADPSSTLATTWDELNAKKFDLAFAVDPLFHKTSAQFDEGGARGLLLNNLSVYRGCEVLFDSLEVPEDAVDEADQREAPATMVNLAPLATQLETLRLTPPAQISSALDDLYVLLGQPVDPAAAGQAEALVAQVLGESEGDTDAAELSMMHATDGAASTAGEQSMNVDPAAQDDDQGYDGYDDAGAGGFGSDNDAEPSRDDGEAEQAADEGHLAAGVWDAQPGSHAHGRQQEGNGAASTVDWLIQSAKLGGVVTRGHGWAGATHWRYSVAAGDASQEAKAAKKPVKREKKKVVLDLLNLPPIPPGAFDLATRKDQICLKTSTPKNTLLPEDFHYKASDLGFFFLRPKEAISVRLREQAAVVAAQPSGEHEDQYASFDGDGGAADSDGDDYDGAGGYGWDAADLDPGNDAAELIEAPHLVGKLVINYSRASKQVDVRALKETIWDRMQHLVEARDGGASPQAQQANAGPVSFQDVLSRLRGGRAGRLEDLSVHLAFICVLHLANEHGLAVTGVPTLDQMNITLT